MIPQVILRGQIYKADLSGFNVKDIGVNKGRPVVVIQNDIGNKYSTDIVVAKITSVTEKRKYPTQYDIMLLYPSRICCETIYTIKKANLLEYMGHLSYNDMYELDTRLAIGLQLILSRKIYKIEVVDTITSYKNPDDIFYLVTIHFVNHDKIEIKVSYTMFQEYFKNFSPSNEKHLHMVEDMLNTLHDIRFLEPFIYEEQYAGLYSPYIK
jgi:mRNA interferase MazF